MRTRLKYTALTLLFLISLNKNYAQEVSTSLIQGTLIDEEQGEIIIGASVYLKKGDSTLVATSSDFDGNFKLSTTYKGQASINVEGIGFKEYTEEITINGDYTFEKPLVLAQNVTVLKGAVIINPDVEHKKQDVGTSTAIHKKDIEKIAPVGTQEAIQWVPGVNGASDDGAGNSRINIGIRGLNPRRSSRVIILEDGMPVQPALYIYPNSYYNPPAERIEGIEIIKGSGSIKYGPHTMGGVINYITSAPRESFGGLSQITYGNNNFFSYYGEVGGWGNKKSDPELSFLIKAGDGFRDNNDFRQINSTFKDVFHLTKDKSLYVKLNYNWEKMNSTYTGITDYIYKYDPKFNPKENDEFTINRGALDLFYNTKVNDSLHGTTKVYANFFNRDWWREDDVFIKAASYGAWKEGVAIDDPSGPSITSQDPTSQTDLIRVGNGVSNFGILRQFQTFGLEHSYEYLHKVGKKNGTLDAGARFHYERFVDAFKEGDSPTDREGSFFDYTTDANGQQVKTLKGRAKKRTFYTNALSAYVNEKLYLTDSLILTAGVRFEYFKQQIIDNLDGNTLTDQVSAIALPGIGFNYGFSKKMNLFGGVHRGYTAPTSGLFSLPEIQSGDISLVPEKSWNYELGIRHHGEITNFEVTGFFLDITDMISPARGVVAVDPISVQNAGVEVFTQIKLSKKNKFIPDFSISYTYLQSKVKKGYTDDILTGYISVSDSVNGESAYEKNGMSADGKVDISGNELPYAPKHTLMVGLTEHVGNKLDLTFSGQYFSQTYSDLWNLSHEEVENNTAYFAAGTDWNEKTYLNNRGDNGPIDAYYILNFTMAYKYNQHWKFIFAVKNLTDEVYIGSRLHSSPNRPNAGQSSGILVGPSRQYFATLKYEF